MAALSATVLIVRKASVEQIDVSMLRETECMGPQITLADSPLPMMRGMIPNARCTAIKALPMSYTGP